MNKLRQCLSRVMEGGGFDVVPVRLFRPCLDQSIKPNINLKLRYVFYFNKWVYGYVIAIKNLLFLFF